MTEGPQAHLIADRMRTALAGRRLDRLAWKTKKGVPPPEQSFRGRRVLNVQCHGKEIFIHLDREETFRIHLLMGGRVRIGPEAEPLDAELKLGLWSNGIRVAVIGAPSIQRMTSQQAAQRIDSLGPDATQKGFDQGRFRRNLKAHPQLTLAECLLDQTIVAGVGNMWKSEILFDAQIDPRTRAGALDLKARSRLARVTHEFMRGSYEAKKRGGKTKLRAYHRAGKPCLVCRTPIEGYLVAGRSTYSCPSCQTLLTGTD